MRQAVAYTLLASRSHAIIMPSSGAAGHILHPKDFVPHDSAAGSSEHARAAVRGVALVRAADTVYEARAPPSPCLARFEDL